MWGNHKFCTLHCCFWFVFFLLTIYCILVSVVLCLFFFSCSLSSESEWNLNNNSNSNNANGIAACIKKAKQPMAARSRWNCIWQKTRPCARNPHANKQMMSNRIIINNESHRNLCILHIFLSIVFLSLSYTLPCVHRT